MAKLIKTDGTIQDLMACNEGFMGKTPDYMEEKLVMLREGYNAYAYLDRGNQMKVLRYLEYWKLEVPAEIQAYEHEIQEAGI